jgi:hypothetical protein
MTFGNYQVGSGDVCLTLLKLPSRRAYSSRTSCSSGERVSAEEEVREVERLMSGVSVAIVA